MTDDRNEPSTVGRSSSNLSRDHEESLDRYRDRLRAHSVTPRQWIKENAHLTPTDAFRKMLWSHYAITYPPPRVPGFIIEDVLGEGGMGRVFLARDPSLNRHVAIKEVTDSVRGGPHAERFRQEAMFLAKLEHPNIVKVHQFVRDTGREFIAMEYLAGGSLTERLAGYRRDFVGFPRLMAKLARAVDFAHGQKIIHRDLKPGNILFDKNDEPKLGDFGLAKDLGDVRERSHGAVLGTHHYMAPEQVDAKTPVPGTDLWALGVVLFRGFAGHFPFDGPSTDELHAAIRTGLPKAMPPEVPAELRRICFKCLEKSPKNRYLRGNDLADDLELAAIEFEADPWWKKLLRVAALAAVGIALIAFVALGAMKLMTLRQPNSLPAMTAIPLLEKLPGPTQSAAFSADGALGLVEVAGAKLVVWDLRKRQILPVVEHGLAKDGVCGTVATSDDGRHICVLGCNTLLGGLSYFELLDAKTFAKIPTKNYMGFRYGRAAAFSPDGQRLALETNERNDIVVGVVGPGKSRLSIYEIGRLKWLPPIAIAAPISCTAFSPDSRLVATACDEPKVQVWNLADRKADYAIPVHEGGVDAVAFSADSSRIYAASIAADSLDVYQASGPREKTIGVKTAAANKMTCAAIVPIGRAVTGHQDGTVAVWDLATGDFRSFRRPGANVSAVAISRDGRQALATFSDFNDVLYQMTPMP